MSTNSNSTPMPSGNARPSDCEQADRAKTDSSKPDRQNRSLVRDLNPGAMKPANGKTYSK